MSDGERTFRLRPSRPKKETTRETKTWSTAFKRLIHVVRMTSRSKDTAGSRAARTSGQKSSTGYRQRCAVRMTYTPNRQAGLWAAHGRYIVRDSAAGGLDASTVGFDDTGRVEDVPARLAAWQASGDPRLFKFIVSPEFGVRLDLTKLTTELMARVSADMTCRLEWLSVNHFNTDHPHTHIAVRGISDGREVRFDRRYVQSGFRQIAEEICTAELGFRTRADALESERCEVAATRVTGLDRRIIKLSAPGSTGVSEVHLAGSAPPNLRHRLGVLTKMGLARRIDTDQWQLDANFQSLLKTMQVATDRQRLVAAHAVHLSDPNLPVRYTPAGRIEALNGIVIAHTLDDQLGRPVMILEGEDRAVHVIPHDSVLERARTSGLLSPGMTVSLQRSSDMRRLTVRPAGLRQPASVSGKGQRNFKSSKQNSPPRDLD